MTAVCEACAPAVFDRYGDGKDTRVDGVALCQLHAATPVLLAALEATLSDLSFLHDRARAFTSTVDADIMDQAMTRARAALRAAKGETS